jgi:hypothetical protein
VPASGPIGPLLVSVVASAASPTPAERPFQLAGVTLSLFRCGIAARCCLCDSALHADTFAAPVVRANPSRVGLACLRCCWTGALCWGCGVEITPDVSHTTHDEDGILSSWCCCCRPEH